MAKGLTVNVNIEGVSLPMTVSSVEDEARIRKAALMINNRLQGMREKFPTLPSDNYYYAMVLLNTTVDVLKLESKSDASPIMEVLDDLGTEISQTIGI